MKSKKWLNGRNFVVSGASSGIGRLLTEKLIEHGCMPAKNNTNPAKTPIFPRFMPNSPSPVQRVRTKSPSTEIIENSDVLVACKYYGAFLG